MIKLVFQSPQRDAVLLHKRPIWLTDTSPERFNPLSGTPRCLTLKKMPCIAKMVSFNPLRGTPRCLTIGALVFWSYPQEFQSPPRDA